MVTRADTERSRRCDRRLRRAHMPGNLCGVPIQHLDASHADDAAATLGEAFFDDPLLLIVAPDEAKRRRWATWFMSLPLHYGLRWGEVWSNDDRSYRSLTRLIRSGLGKVVRNRQVCRARFGLTDRPSRRSAYPRRRNKRLS